MLFWFVYRSPFKAEYRHLTGRHSGHAVDPCFPQRKSSTTRFGGNDHWARLRSKSHPVWKSRWRCEETRFPVWRETPKEKSTWTYHGTDHWFGGWNFWHFGSSSTSRHSIVRGSAVAQNLPTLLLLTSLRISPLKFGQTSLVEVAHGNQLWSSQLTPWIFWGSTNPT